MIALTRILVPTNLGEPSKGAVRYGVALARQFHARLFLLRVLSRQDYDTAIEAERVVELLESDGSADGPAGADVEGTVARSDLRRLLAPDEERDTRAEYLLRPAGVDGPHASIVACARELKIELIVMGKHGLGRIEQIVGGSVTERLIRQAPCPVMVVRQQEHDFVLPDDVPQVAEY